ncbi:Inactive rhomboid protein 1 [Geodia barretti]|uniref:Inactive rhomboid protein 1 n=1 Tax=Geodia barretti TaxID=519541 RepID=A0AA35QZ32_GEOBA|nr:Inactive rhomboid protein 1 [Geodia barretti]
MASYTADQIQKFRQIFRERSAEEGLRLEEFEPAAEACLLSAGLPQPPPHYLSSEFGRLSTTGTVSWQQFLQVLIHSNLNYVPGVGYREDAVSPTSSSSHIPLPPPPYHTQQQSSGPTTNARTTGGGGGIVQSSRSVGFVDSPEVVTVVGYTTDDEVPMEPTTSWGQTLVRGGASLGRAIGNFFGVTDQSQFGTVEQAGWAQVGPASAEETFSIGRRLSFRTGLAEEPPPEYPGPPSVTVATGGGRSFDPAELSDSSEEDDNLFVAAPPDYQDVVSSERPPALPPHQSTVVMAEVHSSSHQVPNSGGQQFFSQSSTAALLTPQTPPITMQQYPPPSRPAQQTPAARSTDFIYDPTDAWNYYLKFVKAERNLRQRRHHQGAFEFFGSVNAAAESNANPTVDEVGRRGSIRRDRLGSSSEPVELRRHKKRKKNTKLQRQSTLVQHKVESLPSFTPWFIIVMSCLQIVALIVLISINGGVAPIRGTPIRHSEFFPSLRSNSTNATERVTYFEAVNLWIGLPPKELIRIGAKFTPCMRRDFEIRDRNTEFYGDNEDTIGCCKNQDNVGDTIRTQDCSCFSGTVNCTVNEGNLSDIAYNTGPCPAGSATFHPCCVSITGRCLVTSKEECDARGGEFHLNFGSCLEVNCMEEVCGFNGASVGADSGTPYLPNANQFWRFFLSIFIHLGVIHIVLIMPVQLYIGFKIERTIGWLRTGIIYLIAGVGGNIVSGVGGEG